MNSLLFRSIQTVSLVAVFACQATNASHSDAKVIVGENNLEDSVNASEAYRQMARSVARNVQGCTSIRLAADLFLTNHHCIEDEVWFQLGWQLGADSSTYLVYEYEWLRRGEKLISNEQLDYAIFRAVRRSGQPGGDRLQEFPPATLTERVYDDSTLVIAVGHPTRMTQQIDESPGCRITYVSEDWFAHGCDTAPGSSGSAIFERTTGHVIGLHHAGDDLDQENYAIRMDRILADIRQRKPELLSAFRVE